MFVLNTSVRLCVAVFLFLILRINVSKSDDPLSLNETKICNELPRADIEKYLSTKTPYRVVENLDDKAVVYEGCQPLRIWSIIRHGARNPSAEHIERIKSELHPLRDKILLMHNGTLCPQFVERFKKWKFSLTAGVEKYLVQEGRDELFNLASRMQKRFPTLLPDRYSKEHYFFKFTKTQRARKSAESFVVGLFGVHFKRDIMDVEALHRDPVLRVSF